LIDWKKAKCVTTFDNLDNLGPNGNISKFLVDCAWNIIGVGWHGGIFRRKSAVSLKGGKIGPSLLLLIINH